MASHHSHDDDIDVNAHRCIALIASLTKDIEGPTFLFSDKNSFEFHF
jgi:hypothetical protein